MWVWILLLLLLLGALIALVYLWIKYLLSPSLPATLQVRPEGKAVLVTGAASGIGRHVTEMLIKNGCFVFACDINHELLHSVFDDVTGVKPISMDVTKQEEIQTAFTIVNEEGRGLYGLVNCAGVIDHEGHTHGIVEIPDEQMLKVMGINFFGMARCCRTFFPLIEQSRGSIVNIASVAGRISLNFSGYYSPSKYAMVAYSNALRGECKAHGVPVRVCCIEPGFVNTPLLSFGPLLKWDRTSRWYDYVVAHHTAREKKMFSMAMPTPEKVTQAIMCGLFCDPAPAHILVDAPSRVVLYKLIGSLMPDSFMDVAAPKK